MTTDGTLAAGGALPERPAASDYIEKGTRAFWFASFALFLGGFATFLLLYCVQPLMPVLSQAFGMDAARSSLVLSSSTIALAVGLLFTGPMSDARGRKPMMVLALAIAALCTIGSALMPHWQGVLAMRVLVGFALSGFTAVAVTYLLEEFHPQHIGLAMGLYIGGNSIGGMSGRVLAGVMVDFVSWRWAVGTMGLLALVAAWLFARHLPASRHFRPRRIPLRQLAGSYLLHLRDPFLPWLFVQAFLLMGSFVTFFNYIGYHLLEAPFSLSQATIGLLSFVYLSGISSAKTGALADRLGRRKVFWAVILMMLAGLLLASFNRLWLLLPGLFLYAFGFFGAHTVASSWIGRRATQGKGQAASLYQIFFYVGASVAGTIGGVFWHWQGWLGVTGFIALMLCASLGIALHLRRLPI